MLLDSLRGLSYCVASFFQTFKGLSEIETKLQTTDDAHQQEAYFHYSMKMCLSVISNDKWCRLQRHQSLR